MKFEDFEKIITDEIDGHCTVQYGKVGIRYLVILTIVDGKIVSIGELTYLLWREYTSYNQAELRQVLSELGKAANVYRQYLVAERTIGAVPSLCYYDDKLTVLWVPKPLEPLHTKILVRNYTKSELKALPDGIFDGNMRELVEAEGGTYDFEKVMHRMVRKDDEDVHEFTYTIETN
jgi:hypothetical protein